MSIAPKALENKLRRKYGPKFKKSRGKNGLEFRINCPFCPKRSGKEDKKYKLYMNPERDQYHCFRCSEKGAVSELFKDIHSSADDMFVRVPPTPLPDNIEPPGELHLLSELPEDHMCIQYLKGRGFDPLILERIFGVRYCGKSYNVSRLFDTTNTLVFPLWMGGKLIGWQARLLYDPNAISEAECGAMNYIQEEDGSYLRPPKYFIPSQVPKGRVLFNYDMARTSEVVVICEGPLDAVAVGPCCVATLGKGVSSQQANLIKAYWKLAITMLDPGDADKESQELYGELYTSLPVVTVSLTGYDDPGDAPTAAIWEQIYDTAASKGINLANYKLSPHMDRSVFKL